MTERIITRLIVSLTAVGIAWLICETIYQVVNLRCQTRPTVIFADSLCDEWDCPCECHEYVVK